VRYRIKHPGYPWHGHEFETDYDAVPVAVRTEAEDQITFEFLPNLEFEVEKVEEPKQ